MFNTLPMSGGLLEQDFMFIYVHRVVINLRAERREMDEKKEARKRPRGNQH